MFNLYEECKWYASILKGHHELQNSNTQKTCCKRNINPKIYFEMLKTILFILWYSIIFYGILRQINHLLKKWNTTTASRQPCRLQKYNDGEKITLKICKMACLYAKQLYFKLLSGMTYRNVFCTIIYLMSENCLYFNE